jgi:uncharacterized protein YjeT (DUF2065 family)
MEYFLCVIGMVFVVEGLPYFGFPEKMKELMSFIQEQDDTTLRAVGAILILVGLLILILARRGIGAV